MMNCEDEYEDELDDECRELNLDRNRYRRYDVLKLTTIIAFSIGDGPEQETIYNRIGQIICNPEYVDILPCSIILIPVSTK